MKTKSITIALDALNREIVTMKKINEEDALKPATKEYNKILIAEMEDAQKDLEEYIEANKDSGQEKDYCLNCRKEIMTESGQLCNACIKSLSGW